MFAATAPAKQSAGDTISVLSSRLGSAMLLEDRRAAILGLRSFAKDYPASVASGALRGLIGSLSREGDRDDVDTVKVVLETLLMLFSPNADSPEASDEIALWLADEFTQRQENVELLLSLIESTDMYSRLYGLQLLSAVHSARPERTEKCILDDPLGVSRLIAVLDDAREPVRNEAIVLLTNLTPGSTEIQQIVAFGGAFEKILDIIALGEGGLSRGSRTVEECLVLLANLVRLNPKNQASFRELGQIPRLARLLGEAYGGTGEDDDEEEMAQWAQEQRDRNVYAMLAVVRLFLVSRASGVLQNQIAFWQSGLLKDALDLGFNQAVQLPLRVEALSACADIIKDVETIQQEFAQFEVLSPQSPQESMFVIEGLLYIIFGSNTQAFDIRYAACECLKAFFYGNDRARLHFIARAIQGHMEGPYESDNVLSVLLQPSPEEQAADPYRAWFAAAVMLHLLYNNSKAKAEAMAVTEGDTESGEEVVTSIQTLAGHTLLWLTDGDPNPDKDRILTGYLMLLLGWLFENMDAVNDFLEEASNVKSLAQAAIRHTAASPAASDINGGLCAMLLGFIYEFSTKDSPVPRAEIHTVITTVLGKDVYVDKLSKLRSHPLMRDFEVTPQRLPDVYFDPLFVEFFKDNFSRATRAIDREPGLEISVSSGVQRGISRELVDSLRAELEEKERQLAGKTRDMQQAIADTEAVKAELAQEKTHLRQKEDEIATLKQTSTTLAQRAKAEADTTKRQAEIDVEQIRRRNDTEKAAFEARLSRLEVDLTQRAQASLDAARKQAETELERLSRLTDAEKADLRATISRLEVDLMKVGKARAQEVQDVKNEYEAKLAQQAEQQAAAVAREREAGRNALEERESTLATIIEERESAERQATERAVALDEEVRRLQMQLADAKKEADAHKKEVDVYKTQADEHRGKIAALESEVKKSTAFASAGVDTKTIAEHEKKVVELEKKVAELEKKLAEAVEKHEGLQGDLDAILELNDDLDQKVARYRKRLVDAGQDVSEDEDEE